ncbi:MAG TPA: chemotaxis response regulator protein-glutamate methylesterase [Candidatus Acidoferrales bacterium]|nr:chemotaxis response regulator protein-glutamate methylesterase [Candidatus Acidoferrales bacterium]
MMTAANKKFRVLIVDDSAFMCRVLQEIISSDPQLQVVGQARDGSEAVTLADSLQPDVITMDINMPRVDGLQATEMIMTRHPRPIVIVSSESREGADSTLRALELGAIEFVPKPSTGIDLDMKTVGEELNRKLKLAAKVRVVRTATLSKIPAGHAPVTATSRSSASIQSGGRLPMVAIAASTGGPAAVMRLVAGLPSEIAAPIFLVLHMPASFTKQFAAQLGEVSPLPVKEAEHNEVPMPGTIYLCPGSHHLRISSTGNIALDAGARIDGYRPCADVAFETLAAYARSLAIGVVLTGMGSDAARGAKAIKSTGGFVVAQDEATSVIFGMPSEAIKAGAVDQVLPLAEIARAIERRVAKLSRLVPAGVR